MAQSTLINTPGKPKLAARLKLLPERAPHGHWEGRLKGERSIAKSCTVFLKADIRLLAGVI